MASSRGLRAKTPVRFVYMKQELYRVLQELGIGYRELSDAEEAKERYYIDAERLEYFIEAIMYVSQIRRQELYNFDIRMVYERLAQLNLTSPEEIEEKLRECLKDVPREVSMKYGELKAPELRKKYFCKKYADLSDPREFIIGLSRYMKTVMAR